MERQLTQDLELDKELECGVSRQLILECLNQMSIYDDIEARNAYLQKSGYETIRSRMLKSMSLKDFLEEIEKHACAGDQNQKAFCEQFLMLMDQNKDTYYAKALIVIEEAELTPYEFHQREKKKKKEEAELKKKQEQEAAEKKL